MGLLLQAVGVAGPHRWRWLLVDERSGEPLADHPVDLDPHASETEAFEDLYRFLRWRAEPDRRVTSETELVGRIGNWIGSAALGEQVGRAIVAAAPVTVRVQVPAGAEFLAFRPWELAHVGGVPLAARGDVALVYDLPGPAGVAKAPVGDALRMLAVFSLPTATSALALRRERYELSRLVRRVATRSSRRVELQVAQYGVTRAVLRDLAESGDGWDVLHLSGHGGAGEFLLERADGSPDPVSTAELIKLLRPMRPRVKLAVVSACQSAAATTAETLRWLGLDDPAAELEAQAAQEARQPSPVGVARALVAELGCAVVAMRYPVIDDFAVGFADALYDRVFRLTQPLDRAVAAAVPAAAGPTPSAARPAISVGTPAIFGASAAGLSLAPPVGEPILDTTKQVMTGFEPEPPRFVGRVEAMAAASAALAPESGRTAVVFHGMVGAGKTACALELAYRHQRAFEALAFWSAPTGPDQFGDALRLLAEALEAQLGDYQFAMVDKIATLAGLENFLPRLRTLLQNTGLLLVLDNLETLLTPDGQWRDPRWAPLISALTGHDGESRVILTSRILPAGLDADTVLIRPVHALSRDESLLLARELPNLRALLHSESEPVRGGTADPALGRRVLTLVQGHPKLLELADAAAADRTRLTSQLAAAEAAVDGAALTTFLATGNTALDAAQFLQTLTAWTTDATTTLTAPARLLLQALCRIEETDRHSTTLDGKNWADLWRRLEEPGDPPPLAEAVAPLVAAALVAADPTDPTNPDTLVRYRIHPGIAEAVHAATPEPVTAAVDSLLAAWWTAVARWGIEQERAGRDTGPIVVGAGLAAAPYLLRQHQWDTASYLLQQARQRDRFSPIIAQAVLPPLRRIAEATGQPKDLAVLASALIEVDPAKAETQLRRVYDQATTVGDLRLARAAASDLVTLLRDQGRLRDALTLIDQKIEHTRDAGTGSWTQLSDQGQRLQILGSLGHHEQVLTDLPALRDRMAELPDQPADNDSVNPWNVQEAILETGHHSAAALERWALALHLIDEVTATMRRRGASPHETARTRFHNYGPLLRLGRLTEADQLLHDCKDVFDTTGDITGLGVVQGARADLEYQRGHLQDAVELERTALRLAYIRPGPGTISGSHHNLALYLSGTRADPAEQRAHGLAAALLSHLTGDVHGLTSTLRAIADDLRSDADGPDAPALPTALSDVIRLVDAGDGVHFGDLVAALCPDPNAADQVLADLLVTAATLPDLPDLYLSKWEPAVTAVVAAATSGHIPAELADALDERGATIGWAGMVAALRRVLAGDRDREQLLTGLDDVDTAIVTAVLDRLPTSPGAGAMTSAATIDALTDHQAIHVLALVVDQQTPLPDPTQLRELEAALSQAADNDPDLRSYRRPDTAPPTEGDLARATLTHLAAARPELVPVIDHAVRLAEDTTRFEPATLALGGLVLIALQTEIKIDRNTTGQWQFRLHKKAMRDSTLGQLLGKLLALYTNTPQK